MEARERGATYGIGGFIAVFVALCMIGVALLVLAGTPGTSTEVVPAEQSVPEGYERPAGADEPSSTTMAPAVTAPPGPSSFPDGSAAPEGVAEVLVDGGSTTLTFALPEEFAVTTATPAVAATEVVVVDDGAALELRTSCARSTDETLAQITVNETGESVTVLAVVLVPTGGAPCASGSDRAIEVPLQAPLAGRALDVVPPGSAIPGIGAVG